MIVAKNGNKRTVLDMARREESKAYNELEFRSQQAREQKLQLDSLLDYRNECMEGLSSARDTGLTPVHVREYQLLMKHINSIVEVSEYKVTASQDNLDKAQDVWQRKNQHFEKVKEAISKNDEAETQKLLKTDSTINPPELTDVVSKKRDDKYDF